MIKPLLFVGAASLGLCFAEPFAMAQDWLADPTYGYVYLSTGFEPDPHQVELTAGEQAHLAAQGTRNAEAWQLTFEGRDLVHEHHKDTVRKGRALLEQALRLDESYALAWGAVSEAYWKEARNEGWSASPVRSLELALEASDRAMALDPSDAGVLAMRGIIMTTLRDFVKKFLDTGLFQERNVTPEDENLSVQPR